MSVLACAALMFTAMRGLATSRQIAALAERGTAEGFMADLRSASPGPPREEVLRDFVARRREDGLRGVALLDAAGQVRARAGDLTGAPGVPDVSRDAWLDHVGGRVRYLPPMPGPHGPPGEPEGDAPPLFGRGPPPEPLRPMLEFEPLLAQSAIRHAARTRTIAVAISALLLGAAAWFWVRSVRGESIERDRRQRDRLAELGTMSTLVAHEIRNPLAAMRGHAQLLAEALDEGTPQREQADRVVNASARLDRLVRDLLDFVREGAVERQPCVVADLVREVAVEFGAAIAVEDATHGEPLTLDARRLRIALANLVQNALQASAEHLELALVREGDALTIVLRDDGTGLAAEDVATVFEPFVTHRTRGIGLGLAVVRRVAELHGGSVAARNHPERGAVFTMVLRGCESARRSAV